MMRKGLTLMELLTVISILATLAALLYPVYLKVRSRMDIHVCAQQLSQIGIALRMYAHDYGDDTPYHIPPNLGNLYPHYIGERDFLVCPTFRKVAPEVVEDMHQYCSRYGYLWSSYFKFDPPFLDKHARECELGLTCPAGWLSFSEVYAKRGEQTPIVFCDTHRYGCPESNVEIHRSPKAKHLDCRSLADPSAPYLILRWGGNVSLVHKSSRDMLVILLTF
jgi:prepilin-type N-terminal cleavage/methylation domain-containing protein